ncbi:MAG: hypothetical protein A2Y38_13910 [Spirochaetes bacterium GWB1_59_5]|nr:MAG: hypothetical protein A2Y38_13910 [Spirochaetes bacterium GWB1_59_5]
MAIEHPTASQRQDLPPAAFAMHYQDAKGNEQHKLPHHINTVASPSDNASVDVPRLRNALARINQTDGPASARAEALAHLRAHAKDLLSSSESNKALGEIDVALRKIDQEIIMEKNEGGMTVGQFLTYAGEQITKAKADKKPEDMQKRLDSLGAACGIAKSVYDSGASAAQIPMYVDRDQQQPTESNLPASVFLGKAALNTPEDITKAMGTVGEQIAELKKGPTAPAAAPAVPAGPEWPTDLATKTFLTKSDKPANEWGNDPAGLK